MSHSVESSLCMQNEHSLLSKINTSLLQCSTTSLNQTIVGNSSQNSKETSHSPTPIKCYGARPWIITLVHECARAISSSNQSEIHQLLWVLNEVSSPYGDHNQRLAYYFLQALFAKVNKSGLRCYETLRVIAEQNYCFNTCMRVMLKFQEVSPWTTFGHVASNGAILEALEGETKLHIIDISNTLCTQWPTFLEALAMKNDDTPSLKLTLVVNTSLQKSIIKETSQRIEKFARLMGVPFKLQVVNNELENMEQLGKENLGVEDGEIIVVNCIQSLQIVGVDKREVVFNMIQLIKPHLITIVEEELLLDMRNSTRNDNIKSFEECLRFSRIYFKMLEESFAQVSYERLKLEKQHSMNIIRILLASEGGDKIVEEYQNENATNEWSKWLKKQAFRPLKYSDDVIGDVKALLKRYKLGWDITLPHKHNDVGIHLKWKDDPVVWASAWKCDRDHVFDSVGTLELLYSDQEPSLPPHT